MLNIIQWTVTFILYFLLTHFKITCCQSCPVKQYLNRYKFSLPLNSTAASRKFLHHNMTNSCLHCHCLVLCCHVKCVCLSKVDFPQETKWSRRERVRYRAGLEGWRSENSIFLFMCEDQPASSPPPPGGAGVNTVDKHTNSTSDLKYILPADDIEAAERDDTWEEGPPRTAASVCSQPAPLPLPTHPHRSTVNKHLLDNKLTCWLSKQGQLYACFYDKELDYGKQHYVVTAADRRPTAGGSEASARLKKIWCLLSENEGGGAKAGVGVGGAVGWGE